jgi:uncharacterized protein (TIGR02246 family)
VIQHTVSFTWKEAVGEADVAALRAMLEQVPARIPAVREYRFGPDLGLAPGAADFAVLAVVDDEARLTAYLQHPFHLEIGERIGAMAGTRRRVQFALPGEPPEVAACALYREIIAAWNARDAEGFASWFHADGVSIGFDGSESIGREVIGSELAGIFAGHPTRPYVTDVEAVHVIGGAVAVLRAVAGMRSAGTGDLDPAFHAKQTVVAERRGAAWAVALLQTTPAQLHGRPEAVAALTERLEAARR